MLIDIKNLSTICSIKVLEEKADRAVSRFLIEPEHIYLFSPGEDLPYYRIKIENDGMLDATIDFEEEDKANAFYDLVLKIILSGDNFAEIDVLEHGAI